jgi:hypothetical protein
VLDFETTDRRPPTQNQSQTHRSSSCQFSRHRPHHANVLPEFLAAVPIKCKIKDLERRREDRHMAFSVVFLVAEEARTMLDLIFNFLAPSSHVPYAVKALERRREDRHIVTAILCF